MNINKIRILMNTSPDLKIRELTINHKIINIIYFESLCNNAEINEFILKPITINKLSNKSDIENKLPHNNYIKIKEEKELYYCLYSGFTIINIDNSYYAFETKFQLDSGINEASNEKTIKGPKDAFSENYQTNLGLIRKRIKSDNLIVKEYIIGTSSKSKVSIIYMNDIAKEEFVNKIEKRIKDISIDYVGNSNYIVENITPKNNMFQSYISTERPDFVSFSLMEGRISILVENSSQVIILPTFFSDYIKNVDDFYQNTKNVSITRIIRLLAFLIAILTPGFYIALTTFNQETLPTTILINFSMQREGVPFPSIIEAILLFISFEILREADTRIPLVVGTSMSIVGALVLGQAAVDAGLISPIMIIIIALSSVASFLFNDNDTVNTIRVWKLIFLLLSAFVGLYGLFIGTLLFVINICSIDNYGFDYTYPFSPFKIKEQINNFILTKKYKYNKRNSLLTKNTLRR